LEWGEDRGSTGIFEGDKEMDWKTKRISEILGMPKLNTEFLQPHVIISLKERIAKVANVGALILYGSIVRGEASPKSDIDLMVVPLKNKNTKTLKKQVMKIVKEIEDEFKLKASFSIIIYTGTEDPYFVWEVVKDGIAIYIKPEMAISSIQNVKPYSLISYSFAGLKDSEKKRIQRFLFESKKGVQIDRSNKMEYIAPGVIVLPLEKSKHVIEFFDEMHLQYSLMKIWR
jgi:predicted nucleotidyltransferase